MHAKPSIAAIIGVIVILGVSGSSSAGGGTPANDACSLLTQAQVSAVLGVAVGAGQRVVPNGPKMCGWSEAGGSTLTRKKVVFTISNTNAFTRGKTPFTGITKTPVSGIGDDAYYVTASGLGTTLNVKKGNAAFSISVHGSGFSVDQIKAMEKTLAQHVLARP